MLFGLRWMTSSPRERPSVQGHDALIDAGADETDTREAAKSVARHDSDFAGIEGSLPVIRWMVGFVLAFTVALTWEVFR